MLLLLLSRDSEQSLPLAQLSVGYWEPEIADRLVECDFKSMKMEEKCFDP